MSKSKIISAKKQRVIGFTVSGLQIIVSVLSGLLFTPFLISSLGQVEYGLYQLLYSAIGYIAILDLGLGSTITRYIIRFDHNNEQESQNSVVTMCLYLYFGISLLSIIAVFIVRAFLPNIFINTIDATNIQKARLLFLLMGISSCISLFDHAFVGILNAFEKYTITKGLRIIRDTLRMIILIILFKVGYDSIAIVSVDLCLMITIALFDVFASRNALKRGLFIGKIDIPLLKEILAFSFFAFLQVIVSQINNSVDRILLGRFSTLFMVGMYGVAMQMYNMFASFGGLFGGLTLPIITRVVCDGNDDSIITQECIKYSRIQCIIMLPLLAGFGLFGKPFIDIWMKCKYDSIQLWLVIMIIVIPSIIEWIETPIFNVMKAKNMQATRSFLLIFVTLSNLFLTVFLVKVIPVYGAAIGTAISFIIGNNILSNVYYHKKVGVNMKVYFKGICKGILPSWIFSILLGLIINFIPGKSLWRFFLVCFIYVIVYAILLCVFGLNSFEKDLAKSFVSRIRKSH